MKIVLGCIFFSLWSYCFSAELSILILDSQSKPIQQAMVSLVAIHPASLDKSDNDYPQPLIPFSVNQEITQFTNENGQVKFPINQKTISDYQIRVRKYSFKDKIEKLKNINITLRLDVENDPIQLSLQKPSNIWLAAIEFNSVEEKKIFQMQCGFCHQLGTQFIVKDRSEQEWQEVIQRMVNYGSRLPSDLQSTLPSLLIKEFDRLQKSSQMLAEPQPWEKHLSHTQITEWPLGDSMSQIHDVIMTKNKIVFAADNIQDRVYAVNTSTNEVVIYKIPHGKSDQAGGLIAARLKAFPKHDSVSNAHSLAESKVDGHIFITPSAQQRLVELNPLTGEFTLHQMEQGFYPHTIRIDATDRVWFTLALSNQVAMFDRTNKKFTYYDLPSRNLKEKIITRYIKMLFTLMNLGLPLNKWLKINNDYIGTPLVYGIDITPDQKVWFTRLHTNEIGVIDPDNNQINMIKTPFIGPRRLRTDAKGNLWITSYAESKIAKYDPLLKKFEMYDLPVNPLGSETPYALNYDKLRDWIWVTGNQSDCIFAFDIKLKTWKIYPLPRRTTFTRDIEFDQDGNAFTSNSNFPSWHIEDAQPTLIQINPNF